MRSIITAFALAGSAANAIPRNVYIPEPKNMLNSRQDFIAQANKIIPVVVGGPQDTFVPNSVIADVGDVIQFQFSNGNHTVTQSAADSPCHPLEGGVNSGHIPFVTNQTTVGTFNMPVLSTDPMFLYCATGPHCIEGQVMVVNPSDIEQVVNYTKLAQAQAENIDSDIVVGGTIGSIDLAAAAFVPAAEEEQAPPAGGGAEAEAPAVTSSTAETASAAESLDTGTTAIISTDTAAATSTAEAGGASTTTLAIIGNTAIATVVLSGTVTTFTTVTVDATASG